MLQMIKLKKLYLDVEIPVYATPGSVGFDLVVHNFKELYDSQRQGIFISEHESEKILLTPHSRLLIGCGFAIQLPQGSTTFHQLEIRSRSGLALKRGLIVLNSPGTIDADYRGEIGAIICNTSEFVMEIKKGDKIAQAVLMQYDIAVFEEVLELDETKRGSGGFGSTGMKVHGVTNSKNS